MPKNIVIFSNGTGQAGGINFDEARTNVYKLYRACRVGPDTKVEPSEQVAFYDPGLGSASDGVFPWPPRTYADLRPFSRVAATVLREHGNNIVEGMDRSHVLFIWPSQTPGGVDALVTTPLRRASTCGTPASRPMASGRKDAKLRNGRDRE
jgi:hypothetical protein